MAINKRGGSWQVELHLGGKRHRKQFQTKEEAELWQARAKDAHRLGNPIPSGRRGGGADGDPATLHELCQWVTQNIWAERRSGDSMAACGRKIVDLIGRDAAPATITTTQIVNARDQMRAKGLKPATCNRHIAAISKMLTVAQDKGWIARKPNCPKLSEKGNERERFLTRDEEAELIRVTREEINDPLGDYYADLWLFLVDTGMRVGAAGQLQWRDISLEGDNPTVHVRPGTTKSGKGRSIPLTKRCAEMMRRRKQQEALEAGHKNGVHPESLPWVRVELFSREYNRVWDKAKREMGLRHDKDFVPHALRHTFCSRLVQKGVSLIQLKALSGHSSTQILERYSHLAPASNRDAIDKLEVNGLDARRD